MKLALALGTLVAAATATSYFAETFSGDWQSRWVQSKKKDDLGKWKVSAGKFFGDAEASKGLQTSEDAHFYAISAKLDEPVDLTQVEGKLYVQFEVKHEQILDCGGGYIKLMPTSTNLVDFNGETPYYIMFGPDQCGADKKIHLIFNHKGTNHLWKKTPRPETDELSHLYTLALDFKKQKYEVMMDGAPVEQGSFEDWDFVPPKEIDDPTDTKPEDWVEEAMIDDPEDKKPEGWDDIPATIVDPEAKKPDDWDADEDGEWEAPTIANPEYVGEWSPKRIPNPEYKGPWAPRKIPNPDYVEEEEFLKYTDIGAVGFDLWQVRSGSIFDNILVTDSQKTIDDSVVEFKKKKEAESEAKDAATKTPPPAPEAADTEDADDDEL